MCVCDAKNKNKQNNKVNDDNKYHKMYLLLKFQITILKIHLHRNSAMRCAGVQLWGERYSRKNTANQPTSIQRRTYRKSNRKIVIVQATNLFLVINFCSSRLHPFHFILFYCAHAATFDVINSTFDPYGLGTQFLFGSFLAIDHHRLICQ